MTKVKKKAKLQKHDPERFFKNFDKVGAALLESLVENDTEAFIEILDSYLQVNREYVAKKWQSNNCSDCARICCLV